jgi:hypothetical protein
MFEFDMVNLVILLLTGPFIEFRCSSVRVFFLLRNIRKIDDRSFTVVNQCLLLQLEINDDKGSAIFGVAICPKVSR